MMQNSPDGVIEYNLIEASGGARGFALIQQRRGDGVRGPYNIRRSRVRFNKILYTDGGVSGAIADFDGEGVTKGDNVIDFNEYVAADLSKVVFSSTDGTGSSFKGWEEFQRLGNEPNGRVTERPVSAILFACTLPARSARQLSRSD